MTTARSNKLHTVPVVANTPSAARRTVGRPAGATREEVLEAAVRSFLAGRRLDVAALAAETGVSRPTVHRWFGTREDLNGIVVAQLTERTVRAAQRRVPPRKGTVRFIVHVAETMADAAALRQFLEQEGEAALRTLTKSDGHVQPNSVALMREILEEESRSGRYTPPADPAVLAYAVVRLVEAFLYNDAVAGIRRDIDGLRAVLEALLRPPA
jgi:AcrR family transcriptional regulator